MLPEYLLPGLDRSAWGTHSLTRLGNGAVSDRQTPPALVHSPCSHLCSGPVPGLSRFREGPLPLPGWASPTLFPESGPPPPLVRSGKLLQDQANVQFAAIPFQTRSAACPQAPSLGSWLSLPLPVVQPSAGSESTGDGACCVPTAQPATSGDCLALLCLLCCKCCHLHAPSTKFSNQPCPGQARFSSPTSPASPGGGTLTKDNSYSSWMQNAK